MASIRSNMFHFLSKPLWYHQYNQIILQRAISKNVSILHCFSKCFHQSATKKKKNDEKFSISQIDYINKLELEVPKDPVKKLLEDSTVSDKEKRTNFEHVWHTKPYNQVKRQLQGTYFHLPKFTKANSATIVLFPGQGTQFIGMSKDCTHIPAVMDLYSVASDILGYDLLKLSLEGPADQLNQTEFQQPAIFLSSLASVEKLRDNNPKALDNCVATAGFSLGEITALTFAGAIPFEAALRLVKIRAEAMQIASDMNPSGMMTVFYGADSKIGFACDVALKYCRNLNMEAVDCRIASYLYPSCKVIAGNDEALNFIEKNQQSLKIRRIKRMNVSGAFHTKLMKPAAEVFKQALMNTQINKPAIAVYSNVDGKKYRDSKHILAQLPKQIYSPVKWEQLMHVLYERGVDVEQPFTYSCGPGRSINTLLKFNNAKAFAKALAV